MGCIEDYSKPVCYFYIDSDGKIAYVGKANGTIKDRISCHAKESKFIKCHCEFDIRYQVFDKASDMDIAEKVYIKSLKPYLNVADATTGFFPEVNVDVYTLPKYEKINALSVVNTEDQKLQRRIIQKQAEARKKKWNEEMAQALPKYYRSDCLHRATDALSTITWEFNEIMAVNAFYPEICCLDVDRVKERPFLNGCLQYLEDFKVIQCDRNDRVTSDGKHWFNAISIRHIEQKQFNEFCEKVRRYLPTTQHIDWTTWKLKDQMEEWNTTSIALVMINAICNHDFKTFEALD